MKCCGKVKDLESRIKTLEDKVLDIDSNQKENKCSIKASKEAKEIKTLSEVAKMFKCGCVCKDERCVMWVPHRPEGFPLWNKQKSGVELNIEIKSDHEDRTHEENRACYIDCKTGKEFSKILLKDVVFHYHDESGIHTLTFDKLADLDDHFMYKCGGFLSVEVTTKDDDSTLLDEETLKNLIYEINKTSKEWLALVDSTPGSLELVKKSNKQ